MDCIVCMETFDNFAHQPIVLNCGHSCCKHCIKIILSSQNPACPYDRKPIKKNKGLQLNLALLNLLPKKKVPEVLNLPNNKPENELLCLQGHTLIYFNDIFSQFPTISTKCSFCKRSLNKDTYYCEPCNLALCEECLEDEKVSALFQSLNIKCNSGHQLRHYLNSANFNSRKHESLRDIECILCEAVWVGSSWTCRQCELDLCFDCVEKAKRAKACICLNCHDLELGYEKTRLRECSICKLRKNFWAQCKECDFSLCGQCVDYQNRNKVKDKIMCPGGHGLVYSEDQYFLFFSVFKHKEIICSLCGSSLTEIKVHHCRICFYQVCRNCYKNAGNSDSFSDFEEIESGCIIDKLSFDNIEVSKYLESIKQKSFNDRIICQNCDQPYEDENLQPLVITCGHSFCKQCVIQFNFYCPIDLKLIKSAKLNYSLLELINHKPVLNDIPELKNLTNIQCPNQHFFSYFSTPKQNLIPDTVILCNFCKQHCIKKFLYCEFCKISLCKACSDDENFCRKLSSHNLLCENNHELGYYSNTSFFYSRIEGEPKIVGCNLCNTNWAGGSWSCRLCNYDLCFCCFENVKKTSQILCYRNHQLDAYLNFKKIYCCSVCKIDKSFFRGRCKLCSYSICERCIDYFYKNKCIDQLCPNGHGLIYSEDLVYLYLYYNKENEIKCNGCYSEITKRKSFHCLPCFFNLCDKCFNTIQRAKQLEKKLMCGLKHEMGYRFNTTQVSRKIINCDECRTQCNLTGTFQCETCKFNLCLKCVHSLTN